MADKKVILEVELIEGNANSKLNELKASLQSLDKTHKDYKPTLQLVAQAERDLAKAQQNRILVEKGLAGSTVKVEKATKKTAKQMKQLSSDTGASTSASLELGRVFSDMPYGIRGVANNIQQLASNLFFMSKKTDEATGKTVGFGGAFKGLGKSLLGPAGVLVAFQAFTAFLDWYSNRTGKAKKATADFSALVDNQAGKLMILSDVLNSTNTSLSEKRKVVSKVNLEFKGLNLVLDEQGKLTETSQKNVDKLTASLVKNAKAQAVLKQITEEQSKIVEIEIERSKRISEAGVGAFKGTLEDLEDQRKKYIARAKAQIDKSNLSEKMKKKSLDNYMKSSTMQRFDALRDFRKKDVEDAEKSIAKIMSIINKEGLLSIYDPENKATERKISPFKTKDELSLEAKDQESVIISLNNKTEQIILKSKEKEKLAAAKSEQEKLDIKKEFALKRLEVEIRYEGDVLYLKEQSEKDAINKKSLIQQTAIARDLAKYKKSLESKGLLDTEKGQKNLKDAKVLASKRTEQAKDEASKTVDEVIAEYDELWEAYAYGAVLRKEAIASGDNKEIEGVSFYLEQYKKLASSLGDFLQAESDRELTIEQNKTNVLNTELNNRLLNENLSKEQRKAIQLEIAQNDEKLRVKQNAIKKKAFNTQKAFNMSVAITDTIAAGVSAARATYGGPLAKILAMTATIGAGMAQVAVIARTKFQPESANTPINTGGGSSNGGGAGRAEPSFNIVGRSNDNILLSAIQSQFDQPLRAYVVARDVTNQQQLDGVISTAAST